MRPEASIGPGTLAVGVIDVATRGTATYNATRQFGTGSIVTADILAAWLLQSQHSGTPIRAQGASLAAEMIEDRSSAAADRMWRLVGGIAGVQAANQVLKLRHTSVAKNGQWAGATTTVNDQLRLLTDLTSARSPLDATARAYAVGLMERAAERRPRSGVAMGASPGTTFAVSSGWLLSPRLAVVDSIGIVRRDGQELLIVVLSKNNPTVGAGIARAEAAAMTAAKVVTSSS